MLDTDANGLNIKIECLSERQDLISNVVEDTIIETDFHLKLAHNLIESDKTYSLHHVMHGM